MNIARHDDERAKLLSNYPNIQVPQGEKIRCVNGVVETPDRPILGFIEGDGIGSDIWKASQDFFDAAVQHCYGGSRKVAWMELYAGVKGNDVCGDYLPEETLDAIREFGVAIKGPLTTPVGKGFRSINVRIRQALDLYACVRPVRHFDGVPSPMKAPEKVDMVIFRENTEDVYAGLELKAGTDEAEQLAQHCREAYGWNIREHSGLALKPVSEAGSKRLVRAAIQYAVKMGRKRVTLVHKGNIMKHTEGAFMRWGYDVAREEFGDRILCEAEFDGADHPDKIIVNDVIADNFLQKIILSPEHFDVIATMNLNGDYISDALAAQVGGIGIAPGANINYENGHAVFEATHGSAPRRANQDIANPSSVILSGQMMFQHLGWTEVSDAIDRALRKTFANKTVTYDFARLMEGATKVKCSEFARALAGNF